MFTRYSTLLMAALINCTQATTQLITVKAQNVRSAAAVFSGFQKAKGRCRAHRG